MFDTKNISGEVCRSKGRKILDLIRSHRVDDKTFYLEGVKKNKKGQYIVNWDAKLYINKNNNLILDLKWKDKNKPGIFYAFKKI